MLFCFIAAQSTGRSAVGILEGMEVFVCALGMERWLHQASTGARWLSPVSVSLTGRLRVGRTEGRQWVPVPSSRKEGRAERDSWDGIQGSCAASIISMLLWHCRDRGGTGNRAGSSYTDTQACFCRCPQSLRYPNPRRTLVWRGSNRKFIEWKLKSYFDVGQQMLDLTSVPRKKNLVNLIFMLYATSFPLYLEELIHWYYVVITCFNLLYLTQNLVHPQSSASPWKYPLAAQDMLFFLDEKETYQIVMLCFVASEKFKLY